MTVGESPIFHSLGDDILVASSMMFDHFERKLEIQRSMSMGSLSFIVPSDSQAVPLSVLRPTAASASFWVYGSSCNSRTLIFNFSFSIAYMQRCSYRRLCFFPLL